MQTLLISFKDFFKKFCALSNGIIKFIPQVGKFPVKTGLKALFENLLKKANFLNLRKNSPKTFRKCLHLMQYLTITKMFIQINSAQTQHPCFVLCDN